MGRSKSAFFPIWPRRAPTQARWLNQLVNLRERFVGKMRSLIGDKLTAEEKAHLDQVGKERAALERELKDLPQSAGKLKDREKKARSDLQQLDCASLGVQRGDSGDGGRAGGHRAVLHPLQGDQKISLRISLSRWRACVR